ncbi:3850_t:CDS:1, partial [Racocetra persica]
FRMDTEFIKAIIEGVAFATTPNPEPQQAPSFVEVLFFGSPPN